MDQLEIVYTFGDFKITDYVMGAILRYIDDGIEPGSFMSAVICNDLKHAVAYADHWNIKNIPAYVSWFYNFAPQDCWGSYKEMETWISEGGSNGKGLPTREWNVADQILGFKY